MGFQNILKLLKSDEQNLNYRQLKLNFDRLVYRCHNTGTNKISLLHTEVEIVREKNISVPDSLSIFFICIV